MFFNENFNEIIVDSHAVVKNNTEKSRGPSNSTAGTIP